MRKTSKNLITVALVTSLSFCTFIQLFANGDPVVRFSAIQKSGNPIPRTIADIQILKENLYIQPVGQYTHVNVEYILRNHSTKDYMDIDYGFPVDYAGEDSCYLASDYISESMFEVGWNKKNIKEVSFWLDDNLLGVKASAEVVKPAAMVFHEDLEDSIYDEGISRRWFYTTFSIPAQKTVKLKVSYLLYHTNQAGLYSSASAHFTKYMATNYMAFSYDFSPAFNWGDGTVHDFTVTVDMTMQHHGSDKELNFQGLNLKRTGNLYTYHQHHFKLKDAKPLQLNFNNTQEPYPDFEELVYGCLNSRYYQITCSGAQEKYPAKNLQDLDSSTTWVAPGDGVGASIVISFPKPEPVTNIILYNGYHKSRDLWEKNSRIKKIRLEVWRKNGVNDEPKDISIPQLRDFKEKENSYDSPTLLCITELYQRPGFPENDVSQYDVKKIKLTILEVTPGTQSKDLCISELFVWAE